MHIRSEAKSRIYRTTIGNIIKYTAETRHETGRILEQWKWEKYKRPLEKHCWTEKETKIGDSTE